VEFFVMEFWTASNLPMPKLTLEAQQLRNEIEDAKALISGASVDLRDIDLRLRQASDKAPHVSDLLGPAHTRLNDLRLRFSKLGEMLNDLYPR
jgi:hypothetical protein